MVGVRFANVGKDQARMLPADLCAFSAFEVATKNSLDKTCSNCYCVTHARITQVLYKQQQQDGWQVRSRKLCALRSHYCLCLDRSSRGIIMLCGFLYLFRVKRFPNVIRKNLAMIVTFAVHHTQHATVV